MRSGISGHIIHEDLVVRSRGEVNKTSFRVVMDEFGDGSGVVAQDLSAMTHGSGTVSGSG